MNENTEGKLHNLKLDVPIAEKFVQPMADTFKVLGDPTRIRILALLAENESCVTNIAETLEMTVPIRANSLAEAEEIAEDGGIKRNMF